MSEYLTPFYLKEYKSASLEPTEIWDVTEKINEAIELSKVQNGFVQIASKHTTLGLVLTELDEPKLIDDIKKYSLRIVPEDERSFRVNKEYLEEFPVTVWGHRCQDNPRCHDEIDEGYNAASHIRSLLFADPTLPRPFRDGKLELGKYQQIGVFEFDGRDGKGRNRINGIRNRTIQVWIYPFGDLIIL